MGRVSLSEQMSLLTLDHGLENDLPDLGTGNQTLNANSTYEGHKLILHFKLTSFLTCSHNTALLQNGLPSMQL